MNGSLAPPESIRPAPAIRGEREFAKTPECGCQCAPAPRLPRTRLPLPESAGGLLQTGRIASACSVDCISPPGEIETGRDAGSLLDGKLTVHALERGDHRDST